MTDTASAGGEADPDLTRPTTGNGSACASPPPIRRQRSQCGATETPCRDTAALCGGLEGIRGLVPRAKPGPAGSRRHHGCGLFDPRREDTERRRAKSPCGGNRGKTSPKRLRLARRRSCSDGDLARGTPHSNAPTAGT